MSLPVAGGATAPLRLDRTVGRVRFAFSGGLDLSSRAGTPARSVTQVPSVAQVSVAQVPPVSAVPSVPGAGRSGPARALVAAALGVAPHDLLLPRQVHSDRVVPADTGWADGAPEADGVVVTAPGRVVGVLGADCMPLLLGDPVHGVAAAVHVGRAGLHADIVAVAVGALVAAGARELLVLPGPTVCGGCYEVPAQMRDEVAARVPAAAATTRQGTPSLDIPAGVRGQLERASQRHGVPVTVDLSWTVCTVEDPSWFSHRRDAPTGRHGGFVAVLA